MINNTLSIPPAMEQIIRHAADKTDRVYSAYCDSCFSYLCDCCPELIKKIGEPKSTLCRTKLKRALINRGHDYYRSVHLRHSRRLKDLDVATVSRSHVLSTLPFDVAEWVESLSQAEREVWPVVIKQRSGVEIAEQLGISPQAVSRRVSTLLDKTQKQLREYEHDRN